MVLSEEHYLSNTNSTYFSVSIPSSISHIMQSCDDGFWGEALGQLN